MNTIAIVIPYYKIDFFEETLKSVASQTGKRFTLYIGNDASPDDPFPLIEKYFPDGNYHYFDYKENFGGKNLAMQWERILENVKEKWFQILGDDDVISENFVEEFYSTLPEVTAANSHVIRSAQQWIDELGHPIRSRTNCPEWFSSGDMWRYKFEEGHPSSLSEHIFRTEIYRKYGFRHLPLAWGTDDFAVLQFSENQQIRFLRHALTKVRISSANISGRTDNEEVKQSAHLQFEKMVLNELSSALYKKSALQLVQQHIDHNYRYGIPLGFSPAKLYLKLGAYRKLVSLPRTWYLLRKSERKRKAP